MSARTLGLLALVPLVPIVVALGVAYVRETLRGGAR